LAGMESNIACGIVSNGSTMLIKMSVELKTCIHLVLPLTVVEQFGEFTEVPLVSVQCTETLRYCQRRSTFF
jgi:c-di-GMP-binding flagellar brake protein YcgR